MRIQFILFPKSSPFVVEEYDNLSIDDDESGFFDFSFSKEFPADYEHNFTDDSSTASATTKASSISSMTMSSLEFVNRNDNIDPQPQQRNDSNCNIEPCRSSVSLDGNSNKSQSGRMDPLLQRCSSDNSCSSCPGFSSSSNLSVAALEHRVETLTLAWGSDDPWVARTWNILGTLCLRQQPQEYHHHRRAIAAFQMSLLHTDSSKNDNTCLADSYFKLGQAYTTVLVHAQNKTPGAHHLHQAVAFLEQALQLYQNNNYTNATTENNDKRGKALSLQRRQKVQEVQYTLGMAWRHRRQWNKAILYWNEAQPHMPSLHAMMQVHCQETGNTIAAQQCYQAAQAIMNASVNNTHQQSCTHDDDAGKLLLLLGNMKLILEKKKQAPVRPSLRRFWTAPLSSTLA